MYANLQNFRVFEEIVGVDEHDGDVRF